MLHSLSRRLVLTISSLVVVMVGVGVLVTQPVSAATKCGTVDTAIITGTICDGASTDEANKDSSKNPIVSVLTFVLQILTGAVGVAAVGAIIYGAILYSSAGGNSGQVEKAKTTIVNTVIGIVCYAGMILILNFIIPGGVFGQQSTTGSGTTPSTPATPSSPTPVSGACYWKQFSSAPGGKFYHRAGNVPYAFENSPEGILYADKHGYDRIDLDLRLTKDGVVVATHTAKPLGKDRIWAGFYDTAGKLTSSKLEIKDLTFAEVSRLKHKDGHRIHSLEYMIGIAKKTKLSLFLELKTPQSLKSHLPEIAAMLNQAQMKAVIAGLTTHAGQQSALAYARKLGFWTRNITAHTWSKPDKDDALCKKLEG